MRAARPQVEALCPHLLFQVEHNAEIIAFTNTAAQAGDDGIFGCRLRKITQESRIDQIDHESVRIIERKHPVPDGRLHIDHEARVLGASPHASAIHSDLTPEGHASEAYNKHQETGSSQRPKHQSGYPCAVITTAQQGGIFTSRA